MPPPPTPWTQLLTRIYCVNMYFFFFNSVLRPFQDYFNSYETGQSVGGRKREDPEKNHLVHYVLGVSSKRDITKNIK